MGTSPRWLLVLILLGCGVGKVEDTSHGGDDATDPGDADVNDTDDASEHDLVDDDGAGDPDDTTPDTTPPTITLTLPTTGAVVGAGTLFVQGTASDDRGLSHVTLSLGTSVINAVGTTSFSGSFDASTLAGGNYTIAARAYDLAGNEASTSVSITLDVDAPAAVIKGLPRDTSCLSHGSLTIGGLGIVAYRYALDSDSFGSQTAVTTPIVIDNLQPDSVHELRVLGQKSDGTWQDEESATTIAWTVATGKETRFRINDALAKAGGTVLQTIYNGAIGSVSNPPTGMHGNDRMSFHVRIVSGALDFTKVHIRWVHQGRTDSLPIANYVTPTSSWQRVEIPLLAFRNEPDRIFSTSSLGFTIFPGAGDGTFAIDELKFTGAKDDFVWLGDDNPPALEGAVFTYLDVSPRDGVIDDPDAPSVIAFDQTASTGGYACSHPVETNSKLRPLDDAEQALWDDERASVTTSIAMPLPVEHPRLFGDNPTWLSTFDAFDDMPCVPGRSGWGTPLDLKDAWDEVTLGVRPCQGEALEPLSRQRNAEMYMNSGDCLAAPPSGDVEACLEGWDYERALRVLHLVRRLRACQEVGGDCWYSESDTDELVERFVAYEIARLPYASWHRTNPNYFDLGAEPAFRFWCLFLDVLWNEPALTSQRRALVNAQLSLRIDWFLEQYKIDHGISMWNGNNWTPVVALGGLYWALTFYYEDARAPRVLERALDILWKHRPFYLNDGAYMEGASTYVGASVSSLLVTQKLLRDGFGARLQSPRWDAVALARHWILEHIAPDGRGVDFGDAWAGKGGGVRPLVLMLLDEELGLAPMGSRPVVGEDACLARQVAANIYYNNDTGDPWDVDDVLARDWTTLAQACALDTSPGARTRAFPDGGVAMLRSRVPGATLLAKAAKNANGGADTEDDDRELFYQADETFIAISAVPNGYPHREKDVGALIWSVFGSRLLWDWGYGDIHGDTSYFVELWDDKNTSDPSDDTVELEHDYFPLSTNTLVVEDALITTVRESHDTLADYNQLSGESATLSTCRLGATLACDNGATSGFHTVHVDASAVYGSTRTGTTNEDGFLSHAARYVVMLHDGTGPSSGSDPLLDGNPWNDGHALVVDAFATKGDRGALTVSEHFFTRREDLAQSAACLSDCSASCLADCKVAPCPTEIASPERLAYCAPSCLNDCSSSCLADCTAPVCTSEVHDTVPSLVNASTMQITPRCAMLDDRAGATPEARGRILAAAKNGGAFTLDSGPITFRNRTNGIERRHRFRYRPSAPSSEDTRVFLLLAGRQNLTPPSASVAYVACGTGKACFDVTIGGDTKRLTLTQTSGRYLITSFE